MSIGVMELIIIGIAVLVAIAVLVVVLVISSSQRRRRASQQQHESQKSLCVRCGEMNGQSARFCRRCGAPLAGG